MSLRFTSVGWPIPEHLKNIRRSTRYIIALIIVKRILKASCVLDEIVIKVKCITVSLKVTDHFCQCHWTMGCAIMLCFFIHLLWYQLCMIRH